MEHGQRYIAVDLGAESGRVMLGTVSADKLELSEIHRFGNGPVQENGSLRWDFEKLFGQIKVGIKKAVAVADGEISSIGVDSWGVDFGLIGSDGELIEKPFNYRDSRTDGMQEKAFELMDKRLIYQNSGIQFMQINTIYQLLAMKLNRSDVLGQSKKLIMTADLVSYFLCGRMYAEYSLGSTSQLMDMRTGQWSKEIFDGLSLPIGIMPEIVKPGTVVGQLTEEIQKELDCGPINVVAVGSHDTACAVAAVPGKSSNWAYLSSGTWSLMGIEVDKAIISDDSFKYSFTNEGGVENTIRFLKNIMGLWLLQECKRQWQRDGVELSYGQLTEMAEQAEGFAGFVDCDYGEFLSPGDMPAKINKYLAGTGQKPTDDKGQMARIIFESLAMKYRSEMEAIENISGREIDVLHIVGGGSRNGLLNQLAANALGKKVVAGPVEATASGNILMQAIGAGQIESLAEARDIVAGSFEVSQYQPKETQLWAKQNFKV